MVGNGTSICVREVGRVGGVVRLRGVGQGFRMNSRAIRTLHNVSFAVCRKRFIAVVNASNSNGSALLGALKYLSAPADNRCLLSNISIHAVDGPRQTILHGHGVNFMFRGCGLLPGAATMRGIRLPLVCGSSVSTSREQGHTVRSLVTIKLNSHLRRGSGRVSNKRVRHITVTHTLIGGPTIVLTSRTANGLSAHASFRVLMLFRGLRTRNHALVFIARGPRVARCDDHGVHLHSKRMIRSAVGPRVLSTTTTLTTLPGGSRSWPWGEVVVGKAGLFGVTLQTLTGGGLHTFLAVLKVVVNITSIVTVLTVNRNSGGDVRRRVSRVKSGVVVVRPKTRVHKKIHRSPSTVRALGLRGCRGLDRRYAGLSNVDPGISSSKRLITKTGGCPSSIDNMDVSCLAVHRLAIRRKRVFARGSVHATTGIYIVNGAVISGLFPSKSSPVKGIVHYGRVPFQMVNILGSGKCGSVNVSRSSIMLTPCDAIVGQLLTRACLDKVFTSTLARSVASRTMSRVAAVLHHRRGLGRASSSSFAVHARRRLDDVLGAAASLVAALLTYVTNVSLIINNVNVVGVVCISMARHAHRVNLHVSIKTQKMSVLDRFLVRTVLVDVAKKLVKIVVNYKTDFVVGAVTR